MRGAGMRRASEEVGNGVRMRKRSTTAYANTRAILQVCALRAEPPVRLTSQDLVGAGKSNAPPS